MTAWLDEFEQRLIKTAIIHGLNIKEAQRIADLIEKINPEYPKWVRLAEALTYVEAGGLEETIRKSEQLKDVRFKGVLAKRCREILDAK